MEDRRETNRSTPQRVENSGQESVERVQWLSLVSFPYTSSIPFTCVACRLERDDQTQWHERYRFADENRSIISKLMFLDLCFLKYFFYFNKHVPRDSLKSDQKSSKHPIHSETLVSAVWKSLKMNILIVK